MYWSENWDNFVRARREALENTAPPEPASATTELLDAVIEKSGAQPRRAGKPSRVVFPTPAYEARFKSCLARVPVDCRIERSAKKTAIAMRPKSIFAFDEMVRTNGLANCPATARVVEWLKLHPTEFIRFENR